MEYQPPLSLRPCGQQGLQLSEQGLGCKSLSKGEYETEETAPTVDEATEVILRALSLGISFLNTSDLYGPFENEGRIGRTVRGMVRGPTIMTKWGPLGTTMAAYARRTLTEQLRRLGKASIDFWVLRGFSEPEVSVEETMMVVKALVDEGKVRYVGLANCTADQLRRAHAVHPISAIEVEWSLCARHNEEEVIPAARALGVGIVAWAPLGCGLLTGQWTSFEDIPKHDRRRLLRRLNQENFGLVRKPGQNIQFTENLKALADEWGCTSCQLALAWLHAQGDDVFPIPGTRNPKHVEENVAALAFSRTLTAEEIAELEAAVPAAQIQGGPALSA